jgi:hypothetical protein
MTLNNIKAHVGFLALVHLIELVVHVSLVSLVALMTFQVMADRRTG